MSHHDVVDGAAMKRIGIFASGVVGNAILAKLLDYAPESLVALVVEKGTFIDTVAIPANCETRQWDDDDVSRSEWLISKHLDVIVLAWWPYLLRGATLGAAPVILNTHPSLLPYCRGKDPNFWAIVEGVPHGVTLHHVNSAIDAGDIAFQKEISVSWLDTGGSLYQRAESAMVELFGEALPSIVYGAIPRVAQTGEGSLHYRSQLDVASHIDLDAPTTAREILNRLRARTFVPYPACRFHDKGEVYEARVTIDRIIQEF
jgi:methionyl-tRNA formyltransferase